MNSFDRFYYLQSIGWKDGDKPLSEDEIQDACNAMFLARQAARQAVLDKLGLTQDEAQALLG